ncbi:MAG: YegS/Rv2252/BmrU family lipid kinase, partial [Gammaproteobacteria bacterium]|nr:YegS/Rv2252/BmrU family lipid kinase [Gammaproteobacteria bacterium]
YLNTLSNAFLTKKISYDVFYTEANSRLTEKKLSEKLCYYSDIVSIGGDGTLNMLSNVLAFKNISLGIIPCGTGNDFSRHIYKKTDDVISTVTKASSIKIDLGKCNERYFINVLGVGYDAMVAEKTKDNSKVIFRSFFYLWNALKYLPFYKEKMVQVNGGGVTKNEETFMVAFGNGSFFGSGMNITPDADITDGVLDCCWVGKLSFVKKILCLVKLYSGEHLSADNIEYGQAKLFEVLSEGHAIEADGEFIGYTPAVISSAEKALLLKVP